MERMLWDNKKPGKKLEKTWDNLDQLRKRWFVPSTFDSMAASEQIVVSGPISSGFEHVTGSELSKVEVTTIVFSLTSDSSPITELLLSW